MSTVAIVVGLVVLLTVGGAVAAWRLAKGTLGTPSEPQAFPVEAPPSPAFSWHSIAVPITILVLTIIVVAFFYRLLPETEVGYHFQSDGSPDAWLSRTAVTLWATIPQLALTIAAAGVTFGVIKLAVYNKLAESTGLRLDGVVRLVGNMAALPQALLFVAMLDIFSYNSWEVHILPLWVLVLIVLTVGSIILAFYFMRTVRQLWGVSRQPPPTRPEEPSP